MKSAAFVTMLMMVLVAAFCLITWNGFSEAWAKGPGGGHVPTSGITQSGNTSNASTDVKDSHDRYADKVSSSDNTVNKHTDKSRFDPYKNFKFRSGF